MAFLPKNLVDAPDYRQKVMICLRKFECEGGVIAFAEDTDPEDPERFRDNTRTQSAYRTFQEFCTFPSVILNTQMFAYNLYRDDLPENSQWARELRAISSPPSPTLGERVIHPRVFYSYVAREWRTLAPDIKRVFYAVSSIRALSVGTQWVEHMWDTEHPQAEEIQTETLTPDRVQKVEQRFGILTLTGPYTTRHLKRMGVRSDPGDSTLDIPRWKVPVFSQTYTFKPDARTLFLSDPYYRVFFWVYVPDLYREAILPLLTNIPSATPPRTPTRRSSRRVRKVIPNAPLPVRMRFSEDLLESVGARLGVSYTPFDMALTIASLQSEGLVPDTPEHARAFEEQYRNHLEI